MPAVKLRMCSCCQRAMYAVLIPDSDGWLVWWCEHCDPTMYHSPLR